MTTRNTKSALEFQMKRLWFRFLDGITPWFLGTRALLLRLHNFARITNDERQIARIATKTSQHRCEELLVRSSKRQSEHEIPESAQTPFREHPGGRLETRAHHGYDFARRSAAWNHRPNMIRLLAPNAQGIIVSAVQEEQIVVCSDSFPSSRTANGWL